MHLFILIFSLSFQPSPLTIISPDFANDGSIPARLTCDGERVTPTIIINGIPQGTASLAVIVENTDASLNTVTRWIVYNIKPTETILENTIPGIQGINSSGKTNYFPPCPDESTQKYVFKVFALDKMLPLKGKVKRRVLEAAMQGHIKGTGQLVGQYARATIIAGKGK
jgi:Raf kinase inhibitor-like YbhB/YbcL family protein